MSDYTFQTHLAGSFDDAIDRVKTALAEEGFGVLSEIDVAATMKAKLDLDMPPYVILGACNPPLAHRALSADPNIGALLPCNVVVRQDGDAVIVTFMDPEAVLDIVDAPAVVAVAREVRQKLQQVRDRL